MGNKFRKQVPDKDPKKAQLAQNVVLTTANKKRKVDSMLRITDIKTPSLLAVYKRNLRELQLELEKSKAKLSKRQYEMEVTFAFWFAVHQQDLQTV